MVSHAAFGESLVGILYASQTYALCPGIASGFQFGQDQVAPHHPEQVGHVVDVLHLHRRERHVLVVFGVCVVGHSAECQAALQSVGILIYKSIQSVLSAEQSHVPLQMFAMTTCSLERLGIAVIFCCIIRFSHHQHRDHREGLLDGCGEQQR